MRSFARSKPLEAAERREVLGGGEERVERDLLRHVSDGGLGQRVFRGTAEHLYAAGVGPDAADRGPDESRLPRTVGTQESENLARQDGERRAVERPAVAEGLDQVADFERESVGHGRESLSSAAVDTSGGRRRPGVEDQKGTGARRPPP